ncbi:MAG: SEC-C metal-binding domain-containing protein [Candidatus Marinimicrobia bacterium]|jgi:hypothetical protein|nr:SEC-C metal-binding domain-containing protein [Candidatus Neomarinimicrobiota bacterium]MDP7331378.1 SEC-C metal-binding domain-containing protein [Candidatus Neomarinimicrobiota bacterium]MDP7564675.1 SEC-C metal-binding domain-containing protein [Candidatus Neomarinimicrobiota bacterium]
MKIGRNDPCHCGSEKKFKDCHGGVDGKKQWKKMAIYGGIAIAVIWFILNIMNTDKGRKAPPGKVWSEEHGHYHDINTQPTPIPPMPSDVQRSLNMPQPDGPAPEGKIWSREHGHWHDINAQPPPVSPIQSGEQQSLNVPQPKGPVPEGKIWSPEHGHWHDIINK